MLNEVIDMHRNNVKEHSLEFLDILSDFLQEESKVQVSISVINRFYVTY